LQSATRGGPAKPHRAGSHNVAVLNCVKTPYGPSHQLFLITTITSLDEARAFGGLMATARSSRRRCFHGSLKDS